MSKYKSKDEDSDDDFNFDDDEDDITESKPESSLSASAPKKSTAISSLGKKLDDLLLDLTTNPPKRLVSIRDLFFRVFFLAAALCVAFCTR